MVPKKDFEIDFQQQIQDLKINLPSVAFSFAADLFLGIISATLKNLIEHIIEHEPGEIK